MMNNNMMSGMASFFNGKGGTVKLAIVGSLIAAVVSEIIDSNYGLNVSAVDRSFSFVPASDMSNQRAYNNLIHEHAQPEQEKIRSSATGNQHEDELKE